MFTHGWIALRTAADPAGDWSEEVPLFGAGKNPPAPYHKTRVDVNALDASLKDTVVYSEPGALVDEGRLYLSLSAVRPRLGFTGVSLSYRIILLASYDHGATWRLVRTLLDPEDAGRFGYDVFDGSSLARENGRFFLLVVPGNKDVMHDGTVAFEFESLATGRLRRDANGQPILAAYFAPPAQHLLRLRRGPSVLRRAQQPRRAHHAAVQREGVPGSVSDLPDRAQNHHERIVNDAIVTPPTTYPSGHRRCRVVRVAVLRGIGAIDEQIQSPAHDLIH